MRKNSFAFCGGAFGDEGKGRIVDEYVTTHLKKGPVIVYRDNGGANAGHTVELPNGKRIAFHQLPSGVLHKKAIVILGKDMVIHPGDLLMEILEVTTLSKTTASIHIDEMASCSLDTHRAFESALKQWQDGGKGSTGRGISPAYADILLRHPIRMRDLVVPNTLAIQKHYRLYKALLQGLGFELAKIKVPAMGMPDGIMVGSENTFITRLDAQAKKLKKYTSDLTHFIQKTWASKKYTYVFEKAQAIGLDYRWGVYPDITASDTTLQGIFSATEGTINPDDIEIKAGVIKSTYMSSVGSRILPSKMDDTLARRIREDANEYGATTKRPRGIAYIDIPALKFFAHVGKINHLVLTHFDIVYPDVPIVVCVEYLIKGKPVNYRPDQQFLNTVKPRYIQFRPWSKEAVQSAKQYKDLPKEAKKYCAFLSKQFGIPLLLLTTGPKRNQTIWIPSKK